MKIVECRIKPRGSFHLGEKEAILEKTSDYIHSDTLFSAICNAYRLLYGTEELIALLEDFVHGKPPFLLSSAFFHIAGIKTFPLPLSINWVKYTDSELLGSLNADREERKKLDRIELLKRLKKVNFVTERIFWRVVEDERRIRGYIDDKNIIQGVLFDAEELASIRSLYKAKGKQDVKFWSHREVPRVAIDRRTSASSIYHFGEVSFAANCGLYFLLDLRMEEYENKLKASIRVLGDEGIGGDRTYGKGLFKAEFKDEKMDSESKNFFVTLSLYYPREEELSMVKDGNYELVKRGGWIYSMDARNLRRRTVRMFAEGSVFKAIDDAKLYGGLANVTPQESTAHEIYRYGYAFAVPMEVG
jgi:CRISPR-associated protein Csm4